MTILHTRARAGWVLLLVAFLITACGPAAPGPEAALHARIDSVLHTTQARIDQRADALAQALRPVPLLTTAQEGALRRHLNRRHLEEARQRGLTPPLDAARLDAQLNAGRLVRLADTSAYWVLRNLDHSVPLVTPSTKALLEDIGQRFQARLAEAGLPPYRLAITSALRSAESQARLRRTNPNAVGGTSTHEFATTVDLAYHVYAVPEAPIEPYADPAMPWLTPHLRAYHDAVFGRVAAEKSREMKAFLGHVLREMQAEGKVLVILERGQPVYHITVAHDYNT